MCRSTRRGRLQSLLLTRSRRAACARHRVSDSRQSFRVHSVDHLLAIMFSYAQARPLRHAALRHGLSHSDARAAVQQTLMLVLAYFASLEMMSVVVAEVACTRPRCAAA
jgi:hypothetical protein